ncbi:MAG: hypothetical protein PHY44_00820 [Lachnospiraceae bacterium]|nr:hypothetical protein [Lachnospiraceae bacterium]
MVKIQFIQAKSLDELQEEINYFLQTIPTSCVRDVRYKSFINGMNVSLTGMIIYEEECGYVKIS